MSRTQFSLRTLLAAVAVVGIGAALWTAEPSWQVGLLEVVFVLAVPTFALVAAANSIGLRKSFFIGVSIPLVISAIICIARFSDDCGGPMAMPDAAAMNDGPAEFNEEIDLKRGLTLLQPFFRVVAVIWASAPILGFFGVFTHWLLVRPPEPKA